MRLILLILFILTKASIIFYAGYLNTFKIDKFNWGNSNNDGLYLLIIPFVILPVILILSALEWVLIKNSRYPGYVKIGLCLSIFIILIITTCSIFEMYWVGFLIACIGSIGIMIESIFLAVQRPLYS